MYRKFKLIRYTLTALILLIGVRAFAVPSNTLSVTPAASAGATITASDENTRNSGISTTYNAHSHTDIAAMTGVNSFTIGDGTAGAKSFLVDDAQSSSPGFRYNNAVGYWVLSTNGSTFDSIGLSSGVVIAGENTFRIGDNTNTGNKRLIANTAAATDAEIRYNVSTSTWQFSDDGSTFSAFASASGAVVSGVNTFQVGDGTTTGNKQIFANTTSGAEDPALMYDVVASQWKLSNTSGTYLPIMTSAQYSQGSFTRNSALSSSSQQITGVGFRPKVVFYYVAESQAAGEFGMGWDTGATRFTASSMHNITAGAWIFDSTRAVRDVTSSGNEYQISNTTMDADGFTTTWLNVGTNSGTLDIYWRAYGN